MTYRLQITTFDATALARLIEECGGEVYAVTNGGYFDGSGIWRINDSVVIWFRIHNYQALWDRCLKRFENRPPKEV